MTLDVARREWLIRAIVLNSRVEKQRLRYFASDGRNLEPRQLHQAEARLHVHWANAATLATPPQTED